MTEIAVVAIIALVILGPEKLPEVARMAGRAMRELRKASRAFQDMLLIEEAQQEAKKRAALAKNNPSEASSTVEEERYVGEPLVGEQAHGGQAEPMSYGSSRYEDEMRPLDGPEDEFELGQDWAPRTTHEVPLPAARFSPSCKVIEMPPKGNEDGVSVGEYKLLAPSWREVELSSPSAGL